jgi:4-hydroxy-tetrahydrodipicolinate reductase
MGEMVGRHEVHFSGPGETVTLQHTAHSRDTFAAGALRAAAWIINRPPGLYTMRNVMS